MGQPRSPRGRAVEVHRRLRDEYPAAECALDHANPFQLLASTILSAQCTDKRVNMVTPALFATYPTPEDLAGAVPHELEEIVRSTGFYANKAGSCGVSREILPSGGQVRWGCPQIPGMEI